MLFYGVLIGHIIEVKKETMAKYGDIIFKLIDKSGQGRATTAANIQF
jgi:hypothetical protein